MPSEALHSAGTIAFVAYRIGLTGGIGSGKNAAAEIFASLGAEVIDTDAVARSLTWRGGAALGAIAAQFGPGALAPDGSLDMARMRSRVFSDAQAARRFEAIVQPLVKEACLRRARESRAVYVVLIVPLLREAGRKALGVDRVARVECPAEVRVARIVRRSGLREAEVRRIVAAQAGNEARLARADDSIDNAGELETLRVRVEALHREYLLLARPA